MEVDLSKPAWGPGSQKISDITAPAEVNTVASQAEEVKVATAVPDTETSVEAPETEEQRVPYSRFKKFRDMALEAQQEVAEWRQKAESLNARQPERVSETGDTPSWWSELYGESDAATKAWKIQESANQRLIDEARSQAIEAVHGERQQETARVRENEEVIDKNLDALQDYAGHQLSEREQSAILDIVDEYTPKDDDGNYLGATIPFEKAWDIYELQQAASKAPRVQSRDRVAALSGSQTQGEPSADAQKNENWNPLDWSAYKKRL